jgi:uncharacterized membrane protein
MTDQFIVPNYHPLLIHYPIALLFSGAAIEVFSFLGWRRHGFRTAGRWMILLGALAGVPAALSGIYALNDVVRRGVSDADSGGSWRELAGASPLIKHSSAWATFVRHTWLESIATAIALLTVTLWIACSDGIRDKLHFVFLVLILGAIGVMGAGAWFGGEGVYRHGGGVISTGDPEPAAASGLLYYVDPLQVHVIGAGVAFALAAVSLGLAFRSMVIARTPEDFHGLAAALGAHTDDEGTDLPHPSPATMEELSLRVPSARFALLTSFAALLTAAGGWWVLAHSGNTSLLAFHDLWMWIRDSTQNSGFWLTRRFAHVICGITIVIAPLFIAIITRWVPRSRIILSFFTCVLLLAIAGQIWLGVLLINDSNAGPVIRFNPAETAK